MNLILLSVASTLVYMILSSAVLAQPRLPFAPTDQEMLILPQECQIARKGGPPAEALLKQLQSQGITGLTHYCAGMNFVNRARFSSLNKTEKRFNLQSAIAEFSYVLKHSNPKARGLKQIQEQKDMAERMLKLL